MNWSLVDPGVIRPWLICETGNRWLTAVRRFEQNIVPAQLVARVEPAGQDEILTKLTHSEPLVVLWEVRGDSLAAHLDALVRSTAINPQALQIIACHHLTHRELSCLTPFPVTAMVQHPEELPRLTHMIHLYFARWTQFID